MLQDERRGPRSAPPPADDEEDEGEYGDEDLLASTAGFVDESGDASPAESGTGSRRASSCCLEVSRIWLSWSFCAVQNV